MSTSLNLGIAASLCLFVSSANAQDNLKPKAATDSEIARYCGALEPSAAEARAAYQLRRLADLEREVRDEVAKLEIKEQAAREWVTQRATLMKQATDDVVLIYAKMPADAAAAQLAAMDESVAAAILSKLKAQAAGSILGEMETEKAARLSTMVSGAPASEKS